MSEPRFGPWPDNVWSKEETENRIRVVEQILAEARGGPLWHWMLKSIDTDPAHDGMAAPTLPAESHCGL